MSYAVLLHFDKDNEDTLMKLWDEALNCGGDPYIIESGIRPHITLAYFEDMNVNSFSDKLESFSRKMNKFSLKLGSIGTFANQQGIVFLAPVVTDYLMELHKEFYEIFDREIEGINSLYTPDNWIPHCTLSIYNNLNTCTSIIKKMIETYTPLSVQISSIGITEHSPKTTYIRNFDID